MGCFKCYLCKQRYITGEPKIVCGKAICLKCMEIIKQEAENRAMRLIVQEELTNIEQITEKGE